MKNYVFVVLLFLVTIVLHAQELPRDGLTAEDYEAIAHSLEVDTFDPAFFSHDVIPPTIKVGITGYLNCSNWLNAGQPVQRIDEMLLSDYVKNVLPNEWISTWDVDALRSGAVAIKMFAWWRINLGGVRPGGADVVDNTCDQVYIANSAKAVTNAAVDDTWNTIMRSESNRVVEIHYLNTDENCTIYFPGKRCMGQWGTQYRALEGMNWQDILHYYYDPVILSEAGDSLPDAPVNTDVIRNGTFSDGFNEWGLSGAASRAIYDGVLAFKGGGVLQSLPYTFTADTTLEITLELGNSSAVTKQPRVYVRNAFNEDDYVVCQFTIPPNTPLQSYVMRGISGNWVNPRFEVVEADNQPDVLVDNVALHIRPNLAISGCHGPDAITDWSFSGGPQGWFIEQGMSNPRLDGGGTRYDLVGGVPSLLSPVIQTAAAFTHVFIQMEGDSCAAISLRQGDTWQRLTFETYPGDNAYYVPIAPEQLITQLRLEPSCSATSGSVKVSRVALLNSETMPFLITPSGVIADAPMYSWNHVENATAYQLYVGEGNATRINEWVDTGAFCVDDTCEFTSKTQLLNGTYTVYLRPWNLNAPGDWFGPFTFRLNAPPPNLVTMTGTTNLNTSRPTYHWENPNTATHFRLYVAPQNAVVDMRLDEWVARDDVCVGNLCAVQSPVDLVNGRYSLYILSWGPGGVSTGWAGPSDFEVNAGAPALPLNLSIATESGRPILTWQDDPATTWVQVYISGTQPYLEWHLKTCSDGVCTLSPDINPTNGTYQVYMRAWGAGGLTEWAGPISFTLNLPAPATVPLLPLTAVNSGNPVFRWQAVDNATWYHLQIDDVFEQWYRGCEGATCTFRPQIDLPNGSYQWSMQAWGPGGMGATSADTFTVNAVRPGQAELIAPEELVYTAAPQFVWRHLPDVSWYQVLVSTSPFDVEGVHLAWYRADDLDCEAFCTLDDVTLEAGSYAWRVLAYSPGGLGNWSGWRTFTVVF